MCWKFTPSLLLPKLPLYINPKRAFLHCVLIHTGQKQTFSLWHHIFSYFFLWWHIHTFCGTTNAYICGHNKGEWSFGLLYWNWCLFMPGSPGHIWIRREIQGFIPTQGMCLQAGSRGTLCEFLPRCLQACTGEIPWGVIPLVHKLGIMFASRSGGFCLKAHPKSGHSNWWHL